MSTRTTVTRRRMIDWFLGTSFGALLLSILYPVLRFVSPPEVPESQTSEVEAGYTTDPEFQEAGFKIIRFGADPVILLRLADGDYRAYTATCTHLDCIVDYRVDKGLIWCWCHNGIYDLSGKNIGGPPPRPLTAFKVNLLPETGQGSRILVVRT